MTTRPWVCVGVAILDRVVHGCELGEEGIVEEVEKDRDLVQRESESERRRRRKAVEERDRGRKREESERARGGKAGRGEVGSVSALSLEASALVLRRLPFGRARAAPALIARQPEGEARGVARGRGKGEWRRGPRRPPRRERQR